MVIDSPKIVVGLADFFCWREHKSSRPQYRKIIHNLSRTPAAISGVEFFLPHKDLFTAHADTISDMLLGRNGLTRSVGRSLYNLPHNSIHLESLKDSHAEDDYVLVRKLQLIFETLGIREFTIHPDGVSLNRLRRLNSFVPPSVRISIENMDCRKVNFQTIDEMGRALELCPNLYCTFDICHWVELGHREDAPQLQQFFQRAKRQISKIHYSLPYGNHRAFGGIRTTHYPVTTSTYALESSFFQSAPSNIPWVLEGVIPLRSEAMLYNEIAALRTVLSSSYQPQISDEALASAA